MSNPPPSYPPKEIRDALFTSLDGVLRSGQIPWDDFTGGVAVVHMADRSLFTVTPDRVICAT